MQGSFTAIITPFKNETIDYESLHQMVEHQIEGGIDGIVPCGTTGESPTLSHKEHNEVIEFVHRKVAGRTKVIAGTGSNSTLECISFSRQAEKTGVDALLIVSPYYNKPTQEGLYEHYKAVAEKVSIEIIVYHIPARTGSSIHIDTFKKLSQVKNITTVKEATGNVEFANALLHHAPEFDILSGNDGLNLALYGCGAHGCISVLSNPYPSAVKKIKTLVDSGKGMEAIKLNQALWALGETMFLETNPIPVKESCHHLGLIATNEMRLPLLPCSKQLAATLHMQMNQFESYWQENYSS